MNLLIDLLNKGMAKISLILAIILSMKYIVRILVIKNNMYTKKLIFLNTYMRYTHKLLGVLIIITGVIHGYFSSYKLLSLNMGTICWIISILLMISFMIRNKLKKSYNWIKFHRILVIVFLITLGLHLLDVKIQDYIK